MSNNLMALVIMDSADASADAFRSAIITDPTLARSVDLQFASAASAAPVVADADVVACGVLSPELIDLANRLKWIAFWSAGLDGKVTEQMSARKLILTNASGVHGPNIAEHVFAMMLMFTRRMEMHLRSQINHTWDRRMPIERPPAAELSGQTLGIVGLGRIGEALTVRARAFGMRVSAVKLNPESRHEHDDGVSPDSLRGLDGLPDLLRESDHVCIALPYTPQTHHLFDAGMLRRMKPTAYLYNIARGAILDERALVGALRDGVIAGAGLDVFEEEPLPASSELWDRQNVIITPHVAGLTPYYFERFAVLFAENLRRFLAGERLNNLYDAERGY